MDVATKIRAQLAEGLWPDQIIAGLVAEGMSEPNARRIVEKVAAEGIPLKHAEAAKEASTPKRRISPEPIVLLAVIGLMAGSWIYQWQKPASEEERAAAERVEQRKVEDQKRVAELAKGGDLQSQAKALVEGMMANAERAGDLQAAIQLLKNDDGFMRCEGARLYKEGKIPDHGGHLARLLETDPDLSVRRCVLDAMLASGAESRSILNVLTRIDSNSVLRDVCIHGYTQLLQDPAEDIRNDAAASLQRLNR